MKVLPAKDPDELLRYTYDFSPDLAEGETLVNPITFVPDVLAGTTIGAVQHDGTSVTVVLGGGDDGFEASYTLTVTTSTNQILQDTLVLPIEAKVAAVMHPGDFTPPTAANLVALFPEFATIQPSVLDYYLGRAARSVDVNWTEGDFGYARMTLAAHLLTTSGIGATAEAQSVKDGSGEFRSMAIGSLRLERFDKSGAGSAYATTRYGREFAVLLRRNRGGPRVAGYAGSVDRSDGDHFGPWTGP